MSQIISSARARDTKFIDVEPVVATPVRYDGVKISIMTDKRVLKMNREKRLARMVEGECSIGGALHERNDYRVFLEMFDKLQMREVRPVEITSSDVA